MNQIQEMQKVLCAWRFDIQISPERYVDYLQETIAQAKLDALERFENIWKNTPADSLDWDVVIQKVRREIKDG